MAALVGRACVSVKDLRVSNKCPDKATFAGEKMLSCDTVDDTRRQVYEGIRGIAPHWRKTIAKEQVAYPGFSPRTLLSSISMDAANIYLGSSRFVHPIPIPSISLARSIARRPYSKSEEISSRFPSALK
ncbi:hypothetical protein KM043_018147 [Ampulex compressa]|nr:hypothetical protein KM043_018147 [Ampulex compressa]